MCRLLICGLLTMAAPLAGQVSQDLQDGEALIWHLGHAGWAVRTKAHFLIFDYWEEQAPPTTPSLSNGYINPEDLRDLRVTVFVTHSHGDHFDPVILEWEDALTDFHYVFGWQASDDGDHLCMTEERDVRRIDGLEISTINHSFDNIPEVAFLVTVDGLTIFHSGDHGTVGDELNPVFKSNIDYLAGLTEGVDLAFLSVFGRRGGGIVNLGDLYTVERLEPQVTFPMHRGRDPRTYADWVQAMKQEGVRATLQHATKRGDRFRYGAGRIVKEAEGSGDR